MSHKISFREYGHGPILILLHGYGGSVMDWDPVVARLQSQYRVVVPNLSHLYMSQNRLLFSVQVELVAEFIRSHFPGEKVHLAGSSFGGALAWGLAVQHESLVDRLILMNPLMPHPVNSFRLPETRYFFVLAMGQKAIERLLPTPIGVSFLKRAAEIFRPGRQRLAKGLEKIQGKKLAFIADLISHFSWILRNEDWNFWNVSLGRVKAPSMMIYTKDDLLFVESGYQELAETLKCSPILQWPGAGHVLSKSHPDEISDELLKFLSHKLAA